MHIMYEWFFKNSKQSIFDKKGIKASVNTF